MEMQLILLANELVLAYYFYLIFSNLLQKLRPYETGGDCDEAVDGDNEAMVAFDALDDAFGSFEQSGGDADPVAFEEFFCDVGQRDNLVADGGDKNEIIHILFRNRCRKFMFSIEVEV